MLKKRPRDPAADAAAGDRDGEVRLARAGAADEDAVALLGDEVAAGEVVYEHLVDRRVGEGEVGDVLGERQPGDRHLVLDGARQLLVDLGLEQVSDETLGFVLALDGGGDDLVEGGAHAEELQRSHHVEDVGAFQVAFRGVIHWDQILLRLS